MTRPLITTDPAVNFGRPMIGSAPVEAVCSRIWAGADGKNRLGVVLMQDQQMFAAREAAKADARPGGYIATGGHGGILGQVNGKRAFVMYAPAYKHTYLSDVRVTQLPDAAWAVRIVNGRLERSDIPIRDARGLLESAIPSVSIVKDGGFCAEDWGRDATLEEDLTALINHKLRLGRLAGLVVEGTVPSGNMTSNARQDLIVRATHCGLPVVRVGRGYPQGFAERMPTVIGGSNLTSTKARFLLMAALMKFGSLPPAADPDHPTAAERRAIQEAVDRYQAIFDQH